VLAGLSAEQAKPIEELHARAIAGIVSAAFEARRARNHAEARRLISAADRLCQQVIGLFPGAAR
jgi:hypothetical protein